MVPRFASKHLWGWPTEWGEIEEFIIQWKMVRGVAGNKERLCFWCFLENILIYKSRMSFPLLMYSLDVRSETFFGIGGF